MHTVENGLASPVRRCVVCRQPATLTIQQRVCDPCATRIAHDLAELPSLLSDVVTLTSTLGASRVDYRDAGEMTAQPVVAWYDLPAGPVQGGRPGGPISGSKARPTPVDINALNIVGPGSTSVRDGYGDQYGELPLWTWLRDWVIDWSRMRYERPVVSTISAAVFWLDSRISWACEYHPAIVDFTAELDVQRGVLRYAAGHRPEKPEPCWGVPCRGCDARALWRHRGDVTCAMCGYMMDSETYGAWVRTQTPTT